MSYDNTNRGVLFKNDKKAKDNDPDYTGSVNVAGVEFFFSGWIKTAGPNARNPGSKFLSVSVSEKGSHATAPKSNRPKPSFDDLGDDIPF